MSEVVAGYTVQRSLGKGRGAEVFQALSADGGAVTLRVLGRDAWSGEALARLRRDLDTFAGITLPGPLLTPIVGADLSGNPAWYAVHRPSSETLGDRLAAGSAPRGAAAAGAACAWAMGLCRGLSSLHAASLVHGDLDPSNVFLDGEALILGDPYLGRPPDPGGDELGIELRFASPEQVQGEPLTPASDVYQLGMIVWFALTGRLPLEDENAFQTMLRRRQDTLPSLQDQGIPEPLERIILKAIQFQPGERYEDATAMAADLQLVDPASGGLLPGHSMPGLAEEEKADPFAGLMVPGESSAPRKPPPPKAGGMAPVLAGVAVVAAVLAFFFLR